MLERVIEKTKIRLYYFIFMHLVFCKIYVFKYQS